MTLFRTTEAQQSRMLGKNPVFLEGKNEWIDQINPTPCPNAEEDKL